MYVSCIIGRITGLLTTATALLSLLFRSIGLFAEEDHRKQQDHADGDTGIRHIKDSKTIVQLRNTERNEIDHIAAMHSAIDQVTQRPTNNQAKDKLVSERSTIDDPHMQINHY